MITTTEAWRIGWRIGLGTAVVAAPLAFVAGGLKCPADPVPCDPSEGLVHVFGTSTATGGPSIVARSLDYAAAEVVIDFKVMRWRTQVLIRPNDA